MHVYIRTSRDTYIHAPIHVYIFIHTTHIHTAIHVGGHTHIHTCIRAYVRPSRHTCGCILAHRQAHIHI